QSEYRGTVSTAPLARTRKGRSAGHAARRPRRTAPTPQLAGCQGENVRRALLPSALLLAFALSSAFAAFPLTVVDDLGREVTLTAAPARVVAMAPSHTEKIGRASSREREQTTLLQA